MRCSLARLSVADLGLGVHDVRSGRFDHHACGALAVAASGDQAGLPDRAELDRFLAGGPDTLR